MYRNITRTLLAAAAAGATVTALGFADVSSAGASAQPAQALASVTSTRVAGVFPRASGPVSRRAPAPAIVPGARLWAKLYDGPGKGTDAARSVAVSPDGTRVFVTGYSHGRAVTGIDYLTAAYDAATGARLWARRYHGAGDGRDFAYSVAVSPGGGRVFVTGGIWTGAAATGDDYATVAYRASTGARLWVKRYSGSGGHGQDTARSVTVSPAGTTVFVTGQSEGANGMGFATVAYNAATGAQRWVQRYSGPTNDAQATAMAISRDGTALYVTGVSAGDDGSPTDIATVAYNATTGAQLWAKRYRGPGNLINGASSVAVSPAGSTVFVTGEQSGVKDLDYATVAYNAATGTQLWASRYNGPGNGDDEARSVAVSPRGATVFVTGYSAGFKNDDYATVAYSASTGAQRWVSRYRSPGNGGDVAHSVAVSSGGAEVFVTGTSKGAYATVAYRAATGARLWVSRYHSHRHRSRHRNLTIAWSMAVNPSGTRVFVTGQSRDDYATIGYRS
jgi:outer membrane protein assembly factor BamB